MKSKKIMLLILLLSVKLLFAQNNNRLLGIDEAIERSLQQSKLLKIDSAKVDEARAKYMQAYNQQLPSAYMSGSYVRVSDNIKPFTIQNSAGTKLELNPQILNQYYSTVSVSEVLYAGNKTKLAIQSMKLLENASRMDARKDKNDIIFNTINAYYNLYKIGQTRKAIEENIVQVKEHLKNIQSYERNGLALKNDVLKIELQLSSLRQSLIDINTAQDIAGYNMSIMLGFPEGTTYQLIADNFFSFSLDKTFEDYLSAGLINRPELRSAENKIKSAEIGLKSTKNNLYPQLIAGANYYDNRPNARVFPVAPEFTGTWDARLTLSWNFGALWTNKSKVAESRSLLQQTKASRELLMDGIKSEVNADYLSYIRSREKIKVSEDAVKQAEENYRIVNNQFKSNTALISDLTDANTLLLQTRINLLADKADTDVAYYKLMQSSASNFFTHYSL